MNSVTKPHQQKTTINSFLGPLDLVLEQNQIIWSNLPTKKPHLSNFEVTGRGRFQTGLELNAVSTLNNTINRNRPKIIESCWKRCKTCFGVCKYGMYLNKILKWRSSENYFKNMVSGVVWGLKRWFARITRSMFNRLKMISQKNDELMQMLRPSNGGLPR